MRFLKTERLTLNITCHEKEIRPAFPGFFCFFCSANFAQNDSVFHFINQFNYPVSSFTVDNIGALYLITPDNQLKKYNENGDSVGVFNQVTNMES